jgi:hypothetical protein
MEAIGEIMDVEDSRLKIVLIGASAIDQLTCEIEKQRPDGQQIVKV